MGDGGRDGFLGELGIKVSQISWTSLSQGAETHNHRVSRPKHATCVQAAQHSWSSKRVITTASTAPNSHLRTLSASVRHLERIPFVKKAELPTYHIGVEWRSNPLVI